MGCSSQKANLDYAYLYDDDLDVFSDTIVGSDMLEQTLIYNNHIYQKNIHTVLLHPVRSELEEPIIDMNKSDSLLLSFDDLDGNFKNFYFTLIHCNADWTPSNLLESEYLEGFTKAPIYNESSL